MPAPKKNVAGYIAKKIIKKVKPELKGTLKTPKPNVKVKLPAKPKPNKPNEAKTTFKNDSSRTRASDRAMREVEKNIIRHGERPTDPSFASKVGERAGNNAKLKRKPNLNKKDRKEDRKYWKDMKNSIDG